MEVVKMRFSITRTTFKFIEAFTLKMQFIGGQEGCLHPFRGNGLHVSCPPIIPLETWGKACCVLDSALPVQSDVKAPAHTKEEGILRNSFTFCGLWEILFSIREQIL